MNIVKAQDMKPMHRNPLHSYTLTKKNQKEELKKQINSQFQQILKYVGISIVQFSSVTQSCLSLCYPMNCSKPGLPVHHQLLEFTKTHVDRVSNAIQPSHPLPSPSLPAPTPSQHQGLFWRVNYLHEVAKDTLFKWCFKDFQCYLTSMWNKHNCMVVWSFFGISLLLELEWKLIFSSPVTTAGLSKLADIMSAAL